MFALKKLISAGLQPCSVLLILVVAGLVLLHFTKKHRAGKILLLVGVVGWFLSTAGLMANALVRPLESAYPPLLPTASLPLTTLSDGSSVPNWIVVLGGGNSEDPSLAPLQRLAEGSVARLTEALRLKRLFPDAKLLLSGGKEHSRLLADAALSLGIPQNQVVRLPSVRDTADEAQAVRALLGPERIVLVTSATHMPRAMALFHKEGLNPVPAPTDFNGGRRPWSLLQLLDLIPNANAGMLTEKALHEYLGLVWAKLRGHV
jgi:uncharacterized SAM-binding protein YcdF (DUF218 family)